MAEYTDKLLGTLNEKEVVLASVFTKNSSVTVQCFGMVANSKKEILFAAVGGVDSALKAIRGIVSVKGRLKVGAGHFSQLDKEYRITNYETDIYAVSKDSTLVFNYLETDEKKKIMIMYDSELLSKGYVSIDDSDSQYISRILRSAPFGLPIREGWEDAVFKGLIHNDCLQQYFGYFDENHFPNGIKVGLINSAPEDVYEFLDQFIKSGRLPFKDDSKDAGKKIMELESLDQYLSEYSQMLLEHVKKEYVPLYDPKIDGIFHEYMKDLKIPLFKKQQEVLSAFVKAFHVQNSAIIQGQMSVGSTARSAIR